MQKIINNTSPTNTEMLLMGSEETLNPETTMGVWMEITTNPDLFTTIINGSMQLSIIEYATENGLQRIGETIELIDEYLK
ncbi:MAG: hypothetical protein LIO77_11000 [Rikenellaceae bacterium]|nr:hypothetical protein [Rikenellaceae bacterium]